MSRDLKPHIGIFGCRNYGKSSLINALTGQEIAIVSHIAGTTTDPVKKSIEIPGIGATILIDTAGIDDIGELGNKRVKKTEEVINIIDLALIIVVNNSIGQYEEKLIGKLNELEIPFFFVHNKSDFQPLHDEFKNKIKSTYNTDLIGFSAVINPEIEQLVSLIAKHIPESAYKKTSIVGDLINYGDIVLLITPIDIEAPEGRLIFLRYKLSETYWITIV
jgi:small GTP-binding protein